MGKECANENMMTLSGRHITLDDGFPTLGDVGTGLSRIPRFVGQTVVPGYSVAHHSYLVYEIARSQCFPTEIYLHALLHDAHEMMTGDICTTFKTRDMKRLQARLDKRIYAGFGLPQPRLGDRELVRFYDSMALLAEAYILTPAPTYERIAEECNAHVNPHYAELVDWVRQWDANQAKARFEMAAEELFLKWGPQ